MGFSLYIHIPYCQAKCPYCDFNSYAATQWPEAQYVAALCAEMDHYAQQQAWQGAAVQTIFFGGGTPSLFAAASIGDILQHAGRCWPIAGDAEITLEANPGTITRDTLRGFRDAGINRMSFGVQSFMPQHLQRLGRIHSGDEGAAAVQLARDAGFNNVSIDLIYALHEQTLPEWEADLERACGLQPDHISAYNLTYEEGTAFHEWRAQGKLRQLAEEIEIAMFTRTHEILGAAGYAQYEISNYAQPGRPCRHNLNYWRSGPYLGVGAGAHSYDGSADWGTRWGNEKTPRTYLAAVERSGHARNAVEALDARRARGEFAFLGLRCTEGFSADAFQDRFATRVDEAFPEVRGLRDEGFLDCSAGRWRLTARGVLIADTIFATFL